MNDQQEYRRLDNHDEIMRAIGGLQADVNTLKRDSHEMKDDIKSIKSYQDKQRGEVKTIGVIWGGITAFVVAIIPSIIGYLMKQK
jgi:hypothetical protein